MAAPFDYGIIYNWDGAPHGYSEVPQTIEGFLEKTYAPLEDTQVGALFWCIGEHAARWPSEALEQLGDVHGRVYENAQSYVHTENIRQMLERGEDPHPALIDRGHELGMHVYASVRMNDNHFSGAQVADLDSLHHTELTRLRREHPEWLLGDRTSEWFALSWDMSVPKVRQHRLDHIREACERYDWDGVELDWQRHAFHLPEDEAHRLRYVLTDLQRAARDLTRKLTEERGRPFYLAARVAGSLEMCRRIGYDIPLWLDEGLVDILIPAGGAATDPSIEVGGFAELVGDRAVAVYPGFDGALPDPHVGPEPLEEKARMRTRAISSRYHAAGAAGIYAFNWHANRESRRELLTQVGSPETLRKQDKIYAATHRFLQDEGEWRGAYRIDRILGDVPVRLKHTVAGGGPVISLSIADDFAANEPVELKLRVRLDQWVKGDRIALRWDGAELGSVRSEYCAISDPHQISDVTSAAWLYSEMSPSQVGPGRHTVEVVLVERHPQLAGDIVVTDVELLVKYG